MHLVTSSSSSRLGRAQSEGVNLVNDALTARIVTALRAAGVESVLLKGASVRRWLYDGDERCSVDIDLLVSGRDRDAADVALSAFGLRYLGQSALGRGRPSGAAGFRHRSAAAAGGSGPRPAARARDGRIRRAGSPFGQRPARGRGIRLDDGPPCSRESGVLGSRAAAAGGFHAGLATAR